MSALTVLAPDIGLAAACLALRINRAGIYRDHARRRHRLSPLRQPTPRPRAPLALSELERQALREVLLIFPRNSGHPRFLEKSPLIVGLQPTIAPRSVSQYPLARSH